jgi:branched-chain amino acid transport system substrate-binding protein
MMRRVHVLALVCGVSCALLSPIAGAAAKPIKIGFIAPLTGPAAANAKDMVDALHMAVEDVGGKVAGRPLQVIVEDDATKPAQGLAKARKLVTEDGIQILSGVMLGSVNGAVAPYVNEKKIPFLTMAASPSDITFKKDTPYMLRPISSGIQVMHPFGEWAYKNLGIKRVVIMGLDYSFGYENLQAFHRTFEEAGGKVIQQIWTPVNALDFAPYLAQLNKDADAICALYWGSFSLRFTKQFEEAGLKGKMKVLGGPTFTDEHALRDMGDEALDIITANSWSAALDTPAAKKFVQEYRKRRGLVPSFYSEMVYSAMRWLFEGIRAVNGNVEDSEKFLAAIKRTKITNAPRGPIALDAYNNAVHNIYVRKVERVGGELQNTVIATIPNVSQFWTYNPDQFIKEPSYSRDYPPCKNCQ